MKFGISFTTVLFFCGIQMILFLRSDSSKMYKYISPKISNKVSYTTEEGMFDSDLNKKSSSSVLEQKSDDRQPSRSDFLSIITQSNSKNSRRTPYIAPRCGLNSAQSLSNSLSQKSREECESLPIQETGASYTKILTPDVFVQVDPLHYLLGKIEKLSLLYSLVIKTELGTRLICKQLPQCYIPYAKLLSSIIQCWSTLSTSALRYMKEISAQRSSRIDSSVSLPEEISSSYELSQFYSSDILNDRAPDKRLLFIFLDMPEDGIEKLKIQLRNFLNNSSKYSKLNSYAFYCVCYAQAMLDFFEKEFAFESLKLDVAKIKSKSPVQTSNQIL